MRRTSGALTLMSSGTIGGRGTVGTTGLLTTSSVGGTTLSNANTVGRFNATNITSGDIALTDTSALLTVTGVSQSGGGAVTIDNTGALTINGGGVSAGGGSITLSSGANLLTVSSPLYSTGTIGLTADTMSLTTQIGGTGLGAGQALQVKLISPFTSGTAINLGSGASGGLALTDTELNKIAGQVVQIGSVSSPAAGAITVNAYSAPATFATTGLALLTGTGSTIDFTGALVLRAALKVQAGSTVSETLSGAITATTFYGTSVGGATLNGANMIGTFGAFSDNGGSSTGISLSDGQALSISGLISSNAGPISLTTTINTRRSAPPPSRPRTIR